MYGDNTWFLGLYLINLESVQWRPASVGRGSFQLSREPLYVQKSLELAWIDWFKVSGFFGRLFGKTLIAQEWDRVRKKVLL